MKPIFLLLLACLGLGTATAQPLTDEWLRQRLAANPNPLFQKVLQNPDTYRLQIIYTRIDRDAQNRPSFKNFYYNVDSTVYFNPASTVKLPLALLSLEKLNDLGLPGVNKYTRIAIDSAYTGQTPHLRDSTSASGFPSIAHFIRKAFLVSENDPYSRMYEFVGQQTINRRLHQMGYPDTRITHRFVRLTPDQNRHTNPVRFLSAQGKVLYSQPGTYNPDPFDFSRTDTVGRAHINAQDSLVQGPFDFSQRNKLPLPALQRILQAVMFPASVPKPQRFRLTPDDYRFLYQYLSQYPAETNYPKYDSAQYFDSYVKFFFMDSLHHHLPAGVRVFNKVGWAYGFLTDASYVADFAHGVEFMLAATVYVNSDGVLNDDRYDEAAVGHPFLYQLGQTIYRYELTRPRTYRPNLQAFKVPYEQRKPDKRPVVKNVVN